MLKQLLSARVTQSSVELENNNGLDGTDRKSVQPETLMDAFLKEKSPVESQSVSRIFPTKGGNREGDDEETRLKGTWLASGARQTVVQHCWTIQYKPGKGVYEAEGQPQANI